MRGLFVQAEDRFCENAKKILFKQLTFQPGFWYTLCDFFDDLVGFPGLSPSGGILYMIRILTDSASDILPAEAEQLGVTVIPLNVTLEDGTVLRDGVDMTPTE